MSKTINLHDGANVYAQGLVVKGGIVEVSFSGSKATIDMSGVTVGEKGFLNVAVNDKSAKEKADEDERKWLAEHDY